MYLEEEMSSKLVMLVDDDPSVAKSLVRVFRSVGLDVETYDSAESFLTREPPNRPSCLLLDVRMPGTSGIDLQETLKKSKLDIPIVFITGHADVPTSVRAMKAGAVDFIEKPFRTQELLAAVQRAIARDSEQRLESYRRVDIEKRFLSLTPRERQVFSLVTDGPANKQVAYDLGASEKTIKVHRGRVMQKMRADSLAELVRMADTIGLDKPSGPGSPGH